LRSLGLIFGSHPSEEFLAQGAITVSCHLQDFATKVCARAGRPILG
jgi:hypothetical protein